MLESRVSQQSTTQANLPQKQEWALIYKHRAMEFEKAKSLQKLISQEKKDNFKRQLDQQIVSKHNVGQAERDQDRRYYEYVVQKAQQQKQKQEKQKFEKYIRMKQLEQANKKLYERASSAKKNENGGKVYLQIGIKSQIQKKQRAQSIRKDVIQTLDQQRQYKQQYKKNERQKQIQQFFKNQQYQQQQFSNRAKNSKKYQQNQGVYNYYKDLYQQKMKKDKELQHKFVDQVLQKRDQEEMKKQYSDILNKQRKNLQMKDTLQKQIQLIHYRRNQQKSTNPQQATYSFINNIFREKKPTFDKRQYSQFLDRQAEQQKLNKLQQHYMNEQQYKFNSNQLNRALSGNYTFDKYHDRSINTLGDKVNIPQVEPLHGEDIDLIKTKLDTLRTRNRSMIHSRSQMDHSFS